MQTKRSGNNSKGDARNADLNNFKKNKSKIKTILVIFEFVRDMCVCVCDFIHVRLLKSIFHDRRSQRVRVGVISIQEQRIYFDFVAS